MLVLSMTARVPGEGRVALKKGWEVTAELLHGENLPQIVN
jgi:hypothetical protein